MLTTESEIALRLMTLLHLKSRDNERIKELVQLDLGRDEQPKFHRILILLRLTKCLL
jgi:hypothetical protein